ncbi:MAG: 5'-3' exonuclease H3TH domain-containing protein [Evtepia sp.]
MPVLKQVLDAANIPRYELAGWEADDLIGTIAKTCEEAGWDCRVATGDKDSLQLVTDRTYIELVTTRMGKTTTKEMDPAAFQETYGFGPLQMVDLKALEITSDSIPGVPGWGEKTAMKLLHENGTLEQIYARLDDETLHATAGVKKTHRRAESAFQSYDLCTIHRDAPIEFDPQENVTKPVNAVPLRALFVQLGFQKLIGQMGLDNAEGPGQAQAGVTGECRLENVTGVARWRELVAQWQGTTVSVLALPELAALSVCWGRTGRRRLSFREAETEDYSGFLAAFFGRRSRSWAITSRT